MRRYNDEYKYTLIVDVTQTHCRHSSKRTVYVKEFQCVYLLGIENLNKVVDRATMLSDIVGLFEWYIVSPMFYIAARVSFILFFIFNRHTLKNSKYKLSSIVDSAASDTLSS